MTIAEDGTIATKTIDSHIYSTRAMDPFVVLQDAGKIAALLGPALEKASLEKSDSVASLASLIGGLLKQLDRPEVLVIVQHLMEASTIDNVELSKTWRNHFRGKIGALLAFITWTAEAQFGDFFAVWRDRVATKLATTAAPESPAVKPAA